MERNANLTKKTWQPLNDSKENLAKTFRRLVATEFVKTCDELVIDLLARKQKP